MEPIKVDISQAIPGGEVAEGLRMRAEEANRLLHTGGGAGSDYLGWVTLPSSTSKRELADIKRVAASLREKAEVIVSIGIGGSYLGARAVTEALGESFRRLRDCRSPQVVFAGHNLSEDYTWELLDALKDRSVALVVISKSGTTIEPAVAFRILKADMERRYGNEEAARRIAVVTDARHGALKEMADKEGYMSFVIPDDVGGRYSVLSPAGLLPIACAGIDIGELIRGARDMEGLLGENATFGQNPAAMYAAVRNELYAKGFKIEIFASYEPRLECLAEWWKQLFGESEGKGGRGIFPAGVNLTADLHSLGQYIQDGERTLFETVLSVGKPARKVIVGPDAANLDGLNYISGRRIGEVNRMAEQGVAMAHVRGGVPNIRIEIPEITPYYIGALVYLFEKACGVSGYLLGVNPFDQPGVESYKHNMLALLGKPGYEI